jgi:hypothetical protein
MAGGKAAPWALAVQARAAAKVICFRGNTENFIGFFESRSAAMRGAPVVAEETFNLAETFLKINKPATYISTMYNLQYKKFRVELKISLMHLFREKTPWALSQI